MIEEDNKEFLDSIAGKEVVERINKEYRLQTHIVKKHAIYFPHVIMTHIPNQTRDSTEAFFNKQLGVRAGASDIALWWGFSYPTWATIWLAKMIKFLGFGFSLMHSGVVELKVDSRVTSAQNKFLSAIRSLGGSEGVARSWREYYELLCSFGIKPVEKCLTFDEPNYLNTKEKYKTAHDWYKP